MAQDRFTRLIKIDKNGTKYYEDWRCSRCGGAGGADAWQFTGYTCWECGGTGMRHSPNIYKEYTPEHEEKLRAQREKAREKKLAEERAKADELNAEFYRKNGFDQDGNMWIALGNTYEIKEMEERIDQLGCNRCIHRFENSHVCDQIIRHPERWSECKFKFEEERK